MKLVDEAVSKCPATYEVRGGPSPILGTYNVSSRTLETGGWKGVVQQIAHTNPADDVYYEDAAHVIVQRANVILYLNVTHEKIIGERSDSSATAESVLRTVDQAPRMRALARGLLGRAALLVGLRPGGGGARDDRAHHRRPTGPWWRRSPRT